MKPLLRSKPMASDFAIFLLRIIFGGLMVRYGYMKLVGFSEMSAQFPDYIGIGPKGNLALVVFAEFFCSILIMVGLFTRLAVIPIFITMLVAFFVAHAKDAFDVKTVAFIFMVLCPVIFLNGSGKISLDKLFFK